MSDAVPNGVLIVDDEVALRNVLASRFADRGLTCFKAGDTASALKILEGTPEIGVVLVDVQMPGKSGLDLIAEAKEVTRREIEFIVMTGAGGMDEAIRSMRLGARDFLQKPVRFADLERAVREGFTALAEKESKRRNRVALERSVQSKSLEIESLVHEIDVARDETLETLVIAAQHRDDETAAHIRRIGAYARELALGLGLDFGQAKQMGSAAMLHDIGKIGVPDSILLKPGALSAQEAETMRTHTVIGHQIMAQSHIRLLQMAAEIALNHHERWDGSGYPRGLGGEAIPLAARITAVCDVYDALRSPRSYKTAVDHRPAVDILLRGDDRTQPHHFDPAIMNVLQRSSEKFEEIYASCPEPSGLP